mgnify:CR=1 FL=1
MNLESPNKNKVAFKTILTYCDLDNKPKDPANDDQFLPVINKLGYNWENGITFDQK